METEHLYTILKNYFTNNPDLMRHLKINACWEYIITEHSINEENPKLHYYLLKKNEKVLVMTKENPGLAPDLTLFFTEDAVLNLIDGNPNTDEFYARFRKAMYNSQSGLQVDNKINKPRLKLLKLGYQKWQKDFKF
jgi:hypothetical protein